MAKGTAGRMAITADAFGNLIDAFVQHCNDDQIIPSDWALITFAKSQGYNISVSTLDRYYQALNGTESTGDGDGKQRDLSAYKPHGEALKKLLSYRQHWAMQSTVDNPKLAGHTAFVLKQPRWGGWSDKQEQSQDIRVDVRLRFDDGKDGK